MEKQRAKICSRCPLNNNGTCDKTRKGPAVVDFEYLGKKRFASVEYPGCGCPLVAKIKSPSSKCPLGKF